MLVARAILYVQPARQLPPGYQVQATFIRKNDLYCVPVFSGPNVYTRRYQFIKSHNQFAPFWRRPGYH
ncbi:hypothetical protein GCM10007385_46390 [Tateyamaria omphalii]|nr:hypothetical protein GCM10007385_46390 [Tateyamaria omphalii]